MRLISTTLIPMGFHAPATRIRSTLAVLSIALALAPSAAIAVDDFGAETSIRAYTAYPTPWTYKHAEAGGINQSTAASVVSHVVPDPWGWHPYFADMNGSAYASLDKGKIGVTAGVIAPRDPGEWVGEDYYVTSYARMFERVMFTNGGEVNAFIPYEFDVDGFTSGPNAGVQYQLLVYSNTSGTLLASESGRLQGSKKVYTDFFEIAPLSEMDVTISFSLNAYAGFAASTIGGGTSLSHFGNTGTYRWSLPRGVTYTSGSGVFNPESIAPVPEPASVAALGLGALGVWKRRKMA